MFEHLALDKTSAVPLHYQLGRAIAALIEDGSLPANTPLPNENELCQLFGISRSTVREAFRELLASGLAYRPKARGVLHVAPKRIHQKLGRIRGFFTEDALTAGLVPSCKVLACDLVSHELVAQRLGLAPQTRFHRVQRVHEGNNLPLVLQVSFIPDTVVPQLTISDATQSLLELIEMRYPAPIARAVQQIQVRAPSVAERKLLHLAGTVHVFNVERVTYASDDQVVEYFTCVMPADRYDFTMDLPVSDRWSTSGDELGWSLNQLITTQSPFPSN